MKAYASLIFIAALICCSSAFAQLVQNDIASHSFVMSGTKTTKVDASSVRAQGKYFWDKDWHRGKIQMRPGNILKLKAMKVNFFTNEVHFPGDSGAGDETSAGIENMKKVILFSNDPADTTAIAATFLILPDPESKKDVLFQVLNEGKTQLLKETKVATKQGTVDPIVGGQTVYFYSDIFYVIKTDAGIRPLKSLGKANILEAVPQAPTAAEWLASNKNKLKKEEDVVAFLNYLNSLTN